MDSAAVSLVEHRVTLPREHEIISLRELSPEEATRIEAAAKLITTVAGSRGFRRVENLSQIAASRVALVEARDQPAPQEVESCRAVVHGLVQARDGFATDAAELLADQAAAEVAADAEAALSELRTSAHWETLAALHEPNAALAFDRDHNLGVMRADQEFTALAPLIDQGFAECEATFTTLLVAIGEDVLEGAQLLRSLHVECPQGIPALLDLEPLETAKEKEPFSMTPRDLPLEFIYEALRLVRTAEKFSDPDREGIIATLHEEEEAGDGVPAWTDEPAEPEDRSPDEPAAETSETPEKPAVVDLPGLLSAAGRLNGVLEEAWSGALARALTNEGIERQMAGVRAAIAGFQRQSEDDEVRVEEFPPSGDVIAEFENDPKRARERLACAQLVAFVDLLDKVQTASRPTRVQVKIREGRTEQLARFWESGAFGRLRALLDLLRNLLDEPQPPDENRFPVEADRRMRLAQAAHHAGDPEGCLFHAACALAWHLSRPVAELERSLPNDGRRAPASVGLRALTAQLRGEPALSLSTLTAPALADLAVDLVLPFAGERAMGPDDVYDLLARDVPHIRLDPE